MIGAAHGSASELLDFLTGNGEVRDGFLADGSEPAHFRRRARRVRLLCRGRHQPLDEHRTDGQRQHSRPQRRVRSEWRDLRRGRPRDPTVHRRRRDLDPGAARAQRIWVRHPVCEVRPGPVRLGRSGRAHDAARRSFAGRRLPEHGRGSQLDAGPLRLDLSFHGDCSVLLLDDLRVREHQLGGARRPADLPLDRRRDHVDAARQSRIRARPGPRGRSALERRGLRRRGHVRPIGARHLSLHGRRRELDGAGRGPRRRLLQCRDRRSDRPDDPLCRRERHRDLPQRRWRGELGLRQRGAHRTRRQRRSRSMRRLRPSSTPEPRAASSAAPISARTGSAWASTRRRSRRSFPIPRRLPRCTRP